jgi:MFS family permease
VLPVSPKSARGLDWFTFLVADIQTGFGPFLAIYLTTQKWNQADIGVVLAIGSLAGLLSQLPGGWLVDAVPSKRRIAMIAVAGIGLSALLIAVAPSFAGILSAKLLHVASSSILGPAIGAITLGLVGHAAVGPRLGRNARFASIGSGTAAGAMGAIGFTISPQAVFFVTAALAIPAIVALSQISAREIDPIRADGGLAGQADAPALAVSALLRDRSLIILTLCIFLFHSANAAMLPLVGTEMTLRAGEWASLLIALCIIVPQGIVALMAPTVGRLAVERGRRSVLIVGFAALPARAALLATTGDPAVVVAAQVLDGICAAVLGVLVPLSLADISRGTGRFNLAQGLVASATGVGAALSTTVAGYLATRFGTPIAFIALAVAAVTAFITVLVAMPETSKENEPR